MQIMLSTRNRSKTDQIKALLTGLNVSVLSLADLGVVGEAVEDGDTLEANALKKAIFANQKTRMWSIADDTGFYIDALNGRPGIYAARWAGEGLSTEEIMRYTLDQLKDVPMDRRTGTFRTVAVVVTQTGWLKFDGSVKGTILTEPRTACQPNMPYSAIFVPDGQQKVWAEMSVEEENSISHRGKAFSQVRNFLHQTLG